MKKQAVIIFFIFFMGIVVKSAPAIDYYRIKSIDTIWTDYPRKKVVFDRAPYYKKGTVVYIGRKLDNEKVLDMKTGEFVDKIYLINRAYIVKKDWKDVTLDYDYVWFSANAPQEGDYISRHKEKFYDMSDDKRIHLNNRPFARMSIAWNGFIRFAAQNLYTHKYEYLNNAIELEFVKNSVVFNGGGISAMKNYVSLYSEWLYRELVINPHLFLSGTFLIGVEYQAYIPDSVELIEKLSQYAQYNDNFERGKYRLESTDFFCGPEIKFYYKYYYLGISYYFTTYRNKYSMWIDTSENTRDAIHLDGPYKKDKYGGFVIKIGLITPRLF